MLIPSVFGDSLFDHWTSPFDSDLFSRRGSRGEKNFMRTDVRKNGDNYEVSIDLPGYKKDDINVSLENGYLTVSAEKRCDHSSDESDRGYIHRERCYGSCSRSFYVGSGISREDVSAKLEDGILNLTVPANSRQLADENKYISIEG